MVEETEVKKTKEFGKAEPLPTKLPTVEATKSTKKIGTFVIINTMHVKGVRFNLEGIRSYALTGADNDALQIAYDTNQTVLRCGNEKQARELLNFIDNYCLGE